ncbi:MAG: hypothetical protein M3R02_29460 [Chloroflexota bacterium]|nr:hypothetical protein [Chloroflexota bacterium]
MSTRKGRHPPVLLLALIALALVARPSSAASQGFQFRTEGAYAEFSFVDDTNGYVTDITVYAADDQLYRATGDTGEPERISKIDVTVTQYDPACLGDGGLKLDAQAGGGGGGSDCFYQSFEGSFSGKDATEGLPEDAFAVSMPGLDGAWLTWTLTLVGWGADGELTQGEAIINLAWTPTGEVYPVRYNSLAHDPPFVATAHVNARQVDAVATGTISFRGKTLDLTSSYAAIFDAQQINT